MKRLAGLDAIPERADAFTDLTFAQSIAGILADVRTRGDDAVAHWAHHFGDATPTRLTDADIQQAAERLPQATRQALSKAADNIQAFAKSVMLSVSPVSLNQPGWRCGLEFRPVARVACYVPGGRHPLPSTALMTAMTARVAGVSDIVILSPQLPDSVVVAGLLCGVTQFYRMGGAHGVAAMAYGTETVPPVSMIVGPGNRAVTEAKRQLQGVVGIDMLAGPSEVALIADQSARPDWVALDLLAQAEHDPDARAYLLTDSAALIDAVAAVLPQQAQALNLPAFVLGGVVSVLLPDLATCAMACNRLAAEHVELHVTDPWALKPLLTDYGALFLGENTPVPYGDYTAGPNHTLPTGRAARFSGALNPLTFLRAQTWAEASNSQLAELTAQLADLEGLTAHAASARARA
jgi:histidinol dehydrogenase